MLLCRPDAFRDLWKGVIKEVVLPLIRPDGEEMEMF